MSQNKGKRAGHWVAAYLRRWYPSAESPHSSAPGRDILGTPGICVEVKTSPTWRSTAVNQVMGYRREPEFAFVIYLPPGVGERQVGKALAIMPLEELMGVLVESGHAPEPADAGAPRRVTEPIRDSEPEVVARVRNGGIVAEAAMIEAVPGDHGNRVFEKGTAGELADG